MNPAVGTLARQRWNWRLPIGELWKIGPRSYLDVARGELAERAEIERGRFFRVPGASERELDRWLAEQRPLAVEVYRPPSQRQ